MEHSGSGGNIDWKRGYVELKDDQTQYDLQSLWGDCVEGELIEVKRIFHYRPPASSYLRSIFNDRYELF